MLRPAEIVAARVSRRAADRVATDGLGLAPFLQSLLRHARAGAAATGQNWTADQERADRDR